MLWKDVIRFWMELVDHFAGLSLLIDCWPKSGSKSERNKDIRRWSRTCKIVLPLKNSCGPYSHWNCYRDKMHPWCEQWSLQTCPPITSRELQLRDVTYSPLRLPPFFTEKSVPERCVSSILARNLWREMPLK